MVTADPDPLRCVEVYRSLPDGSVPGYGTGYRIASGLVATAAHVLAGGTDPFVRIGTALTITARLEWQDAELDLALLSVPAGLLSEVPPVRIGILPEQAGQVDFRAIGYPTLATRPGDGRSVRDTAQVDGTLQLGSNQKSKLVSLLVNHPPVGAPASGGDPWRGLSGASVFARPGGELVGIVTSRLPAAGTGSLDARSLADVTDRGFWTILEAAGISRHPISQGDPVPALLTHGETLERLSGSRLYLSPERLEFVSPGDHLSAPDTLFALLSGNDPEHVLLSGPPGTGKTRTCFEVARIAEAANWRTFHVQPYEPLDNNQDLGRAVLAGGGPALIIVDTLYECQSIDLDWIRTRLTVEAQKRDAPFAILATIRPEQLRIMSHSRDFKTNVDALFHKVRIRDDKSHAAAITKAILSEAAPQAIARYGRLAVERKCGRRPVAALLIATDIEKRLDLERDPLGGPPAEDSELVDWLARRLNDDRLTPVPPAEPGPFAAVAVPPALVASAMLAASCPLAREELQSIAEAVLTALGAPGETAGRLLDLLISAGWLEREGRRVVVAHDIVTDELLRRVLLPETDGPVATYTLTVLLDATLGSPSAFELLSGALTRTVRGLPGNVSAELLPQAGAWLRQHVNDIAASLTRMPTHQSARAVATLLYSQLWTTVAVEFWDVLIAPWLRRYQRHPQARHLLYLSFSRTPDQVSDQLVEAALRWLREHGERIEASFILQALWRWQLSDRQQSEVRQRTDRWLRLYAQAPEARWLIATLLRRHRHLAAAELGVYQDAARRWLVKNGQNIDAVPLIADSLNCGNLELVRQARKSATAWLRDYSAVPDAAQVLAPILRKTRYYTPELRQWTLRWLEHHSDKRQGASIMLALLDRHHVADAATRATAVRKAADWLESHADSDNSVFRSLLSRMITREDPDVATRIITLAMGWLVRVGDSPSSRPLLRQLLRRRDLPDSVKRVSARRTLEFIRSAAPSSDMSLVITPLLGNPDVKVRAAARTEAVRCLTEHGDSADIWRLFDETLRHPELSADQVARVSQRARHWLGLHFKEAGSPFVLAALLHRRDLSQADREDAIQLGTRWLEYLPLAEETALVLAALLDRDDLAVPQRRKIEEQAAGWLRKNRGSRRTGRVAGALTRSRRVTTVRKPRQRERPQPEQPPRESRESRESREAEGLKRRRHRPRRLPAWLHDDLEVGVPEGDLADVPPLGLRLVGDLFEVDDE